MPSRTSPPSCSRAARLSRTAAVKAASLIFLGGCTTVGMHERASLEGHDFGPTEQLRICVLADDGISEENARNLLAEVADEFSPFGLDVSVPWVKRWERPAFFMQGIVEDLWLRPLDAPCDRLLALVGRNFGDFVWGLVGPEVLGAVDTPTHSRGYVVAKTSSLNQLVTSPASTAIHESYHLLGCDHASQLSSCYGQIAKLKRLARANREAGASFFPTLSWTGRPLTDRYQVNAGLGAAIAAVASTRIPQQPSPFASSPN